MRFLARNIAKPIALTIFLLMLGSAMAQQPKAIRIGFYNTENYFDTINDPATDDGDYCDSNFYNYAQKTEELTEAITLFNPDILALCEVENYSALENLTDALSQKTDKIYNIIHYDSKDSRGIDCAAIYDTAIVRLISSEPIFTDYLYRNFIRAEFTSKLSGENFTVYIAHLPSKIGGQKAAKNRDKALEALDSLALSEKSLKAIICGDMNANPQQGEILENLAHKAYKEGKASYAYQGVWTMPDQIIITPELKRNLLSEQIIVHHPSLINPNGKYRGYPKKNRPSDHLPIFVDIKF